MTLRDTPDDHDARRRVVFAFRRAPDLVEPGDALLLQSLLGDPLNDPSTIESAGWELLRKAGYLPLRDTDPADTARWLEEDELARALLIETKVTILPVEQLLTALRRWLLLTASDKAFPRATAALVRQAALNGGAWPFDAEERAALRAGASMASAYLPPRPVLNPDAAVFVAPITGAVAAQYESWPYPAWERSAIAPTDTLAARLARLGPGAPSAPAHPQILVAGCGTGREAARWARRAPDGHVTAIDLSAASLRYAADRCSDIPNIRFEQRDLHDVAALGDRFDVIACSGVLHHLPDPEAGWAALAHVLKPGGVMQVMLYSKLARMIVTSARRRIGDLAHGLVDDDLLREVRARLIADPPHDITGSPDFYDLGGVHDLLLHAHEDPFDVPRIRNAIDRLGLEFLGFGLPTSAARRRYRAEHPDDPWRRDYQGWAAIERRNPRIFSGMYRFWCMKHTESR
jgi:SAM-dependent methyltransferase